MCQYSFRLLKVSVVCTGVEVYTGSWTKLILVHMGPG
jgi:hypothetical protein